MKCEKTRLRNWNTVHCKNEAKHEHEGKQYCSTHYPPNVAEKNRKLHAKWDEESRLRQEQWRKERAMSKLCLGLTAEQIEKASLVLND